MHFFSLCESRIDPDKAGQMNLWYANSMRFHWQLKKRLRKTWGLSDNLILDYEDT